MTYQLATSARKHLKKLPQLTQVRIIKKIKFICQQPSPLNYATKLTHRDTGTYRFRIGTYRVIFDVVNADTLLILDIGHRRSIYR